ncbi:hypothetical protein E2E30_07980 [Sphingomonas sp. AAP5]|jgi:hypothetical protein|uniref:Uncharacterized protein n=1 Tax=Sphingomonas glacialis TaxID=658225 RepID=A0ABQ3L8U1_9SPHN|nr:MULTISPECIES: hypothetical protein [Sphingomonas]QBM75718.1 hypothetical protein E2E30_07980 [Sphingomonas sp. AAP5]GHH08970.1 hypothetical protein GCM10008023_05060 [Sphingomonas glacialis]
MTSVLLPVLVALTAAPLAAQTAPAPAVTTTSTTTTASTAKFTLETPIETIAADPKGKAVLDTDLQNITAHPMYDQFKSMSLAQVQPMSQGALTDAALAKVKIDLEAIK